MTRTESSLARHSVNTPGVLSTAETGRFRRLRSSCPRKAGEGHAARGVMAANADSHSGSNSCNL